MTTTKQIIIFTLTILVASCSSRTDRKDFVHSYEKYWDKYTDQQLVDTLFSDTLDVGPDTEGGWTTREFYINTTKELIADLKDDKNKVDSLYPMTAFDELTIKKIPIGFSKTLTNEQTAKFLEIINDPVSFDWAETTYEPEYKIEFLKNSKTVATLTIGADKSIIKTEPDWPDFKKMKFGRLKSEAYNEMTKLLNEVGQ
ncbi:hypothetical protein [Flavobacterium sp. N2270]|uniref:hypothetical protein n=1 Tax=Flavobacterium sp. N2270 TaxID=2986831 RepID=UPI0022258561|nr:hypothetical protein [Flavobacterium sp. N2270]